MTASPDVLDLVRRWAAAERDNDAGALFRVTLVAVSRAGRWLLANVHIGPLDYPAARTSG